MSIKTSIKDGQGTNLEACVKETPLGENSLCVNISNSSGGSAVSISPFASGGQTDYRLSEDGLGVNYNAAVNGTLGSPIEFKITPIEGKDFIITELSVVAIDSGIKINNWIGLNSSLANGCILKIKANDQVTEYFPFQKTSDLASFASISGFDLYVEAGGDLVKMTRQFTPLLVIRAQDTFGTSEPQQDYVSWTVQDSHQGITEIRIEARGYLTEPGEF